MCSGCFRFYIPRDSGNVKPERRSVMTEDRRAGFAISIAADRADLPIQNLRVYERRGLLEPARTAGGTRLYSEADIVVLRRISELLGEGLNLAGIRRVLELEAEIVRLEAAVASVPKP
jgi:MerR family transcriptional regulator, heat shock protein HspR